MLPTAVQPRISRAPILLHICDFYRPVYYSTGSGPLQAFSGTDPPGRV